MGRAPCCDKSKVKRGPWSPQEDATLKTYLQFHGTRGNWITLPQKAGLKRCGKSCHLRWLNYLRPDIKHGGFTEEEDNIIFTLYSQMGSRWSLMASHLPGRTDDDVKNYWNTKLKKKLLLAAKTSLEIHNTTIFNDTNNHSTTVSCSSQPLVLPFVPESEPDSNLLPFRDSSLAPNSDTLPMLSEITHESIINNTLDPVHQFSYPDHVIIDVLEPGSDSINCHIVSSSQQGSSISGSSSIAVENNKQLSLPCHGDNINLEENKILMDYGFNFPNYDIFCQDNKAIASTCYPNSDW